MGHGRPAPYTGELESGESPQWGLSGPQFSGGSVSLSVACSLPTHRAPGLFSASPCPLDSLAEGACPKGLGSPGDRQEWARINEPERRRESPQESTFPTSSAAPNFRGAVPWGGLQGSRRRSSDLRRLTWPLLAARRACVSGSGALASPLSTLHRPTSSGGAPLPVRSVSPPTVRPSLLVSHPPCRPPCPWPVSRQPSRGRRRCLSLCVMWPQGRPAQGSWPLDSKNVLRGVGWRAEGAPRRGLPGGQGQAAQPQPLLGGQIRVPSAPPEGPAVCPEDSCPLAAVCLRPAPPSPLD